MYEMTTLWRYGDLNTQIAEQCNSKIATMVSQDKTDGLYMRSRMSESWHFVRTFVDEAAAQEYQDFLMQLTPNTPISIQIKPV